MERRFSFLGFEFFWFPDRKGIPRVTRRTAGKKLRAALKRITEWIRLNRHKPKHWFYQQVNVKLQGHYTYYGVHGNLRSLWLFYEKVTQACFTWLNRRSQRRSYTWEAFKRLLSYIGLVKPHITESTRLRQGGC